MQKRIIDQTGSEYVHEYFTDRAMAKGQSTKMRISDRLIGFDANLKPVRQYTNRGESIFVIFEDYALVASDTKPEMSTEF